MQARQEEAYRLCPLLGPRESQIFWGPLWTAREPVGEGTGPARQAGSYRPAALTWHSMLSACWRALAAMGRRHTTSRSLEEQEGQGPGAYRRPGSSDRWTEAYCQGAVDTAPGSCTRRAIRWRQGPGRAPGVCGQSSAAEPGVDGMSPPPIRHQAPGCTGCTLSGTFPAARAGGHGERGKPWKTGRGWCFRSRRPGLKSVCASFSAAHMESSPSR